MFGQQFDVFFHTAPSVIKTILDGMADAREAFEVR